MASTIVSYVVRQHAEEAVGIANVRWRLASASHVKLRHLRRFDDRLLAQLDGLATAGGEGVRFVEEALQSPGMAELFVAAVRAIEDHSAGRLERVLAVAQAVPECQDGLFAAFAWVDPVHLRGLAAEMLRSDEPFHRMAGIGACAVHGIDVPSVPLRTPETTPIMVRRRLLRAAGEIGKHEAIRDCLAALSDEDAETRLWGAWSAVLLGNRSFALDALKFAAVNDATASTPLQLAVAATDIKGAHKVLQRLATDSGKMRSLLLGSGISGDARYISWLIEEMVKPETARLAGEAFSLITGADLALLDLDRKPPDGFESGPTDDPGETDVDIDPDDGLPWPDRERIQAWWVAHRDQFAPGRRYFVGGPLTRQHCLSVLKDGYQRQRLLAAYHLCLLDPGMPLFDTSAPAWRQQRLLARLS